ncbi:MAG: acetyl-CoA carboxylase biotin carboxyl carrier protein [Sedimentisphaerales bacterium]
MAQWDDQLGKLKQIIEIMKEHNLVEVQMKQGDSEISVKKGQAGQPHISAIPIIGTAMPPVMSGAAAPAAGAAGQAQAPQAPQVNLVEIKSPLVGTFYAQPSPDSEPYIEVGSRVDPQSVVCIIEAMKVMNEIKAEVSGAIVEVVAVSGEAVEYGQVLFRVRPD